MSATQSDLNRGLPQPGASRPLEAQGGCHPQTWGSLMMTVEMGMPRGPYQQALKLPNNSPCASGQLEKEFLFPRQFSF